MEVKRGIPRKGIEVGDTIRAAWTDKGLKHTTEGTVVSFTGYGTPINKEQRYIGPSVLDDNYFVSYTLLHRPEKDILDGKKNGDKLEYKSIISGYTYIFTKLSDDQWLEESFLKGSTSEPAFRIVNGAAVRKSHGYFKAVAS